MLDPLDQELSKYSLQELKSLQEKIKDRLDKPFDSESEHRLYDALTSLISSKIVPQFSIGRYRADFCIPDHNLVIEVKGWPYHGQDRERFSADSQRERAIVLSGYRFIWFNSEEVLNDPEQCAKEVLAFTQSVDSVDLISTAYSLNPYLCLPGDIEQGRYKKWAMIETFGKIVDIRDTPKGLFADLVAYGDRVQIKMFKPQKPGEITGYSLFGERVTMGKVVYLSGSVDYHLNQAGALKVRWDKDVSLIGNVIDGVEYVESIKTGSIVPAPPTSPIERDESDVPPSQPPYVHSIGSSDNQGYNPY
jgi:very-short-patch-repair endonuclease